MYPKVLGWITGGVGWLHSTVPCVSTYYNKNLFILRVCLLHHVDTDFVGKMKNVFYENKVSFEGFVKRNSPVQYEGSVISGQGYEISSIL